VHVIALHVVTIARGPVYLHTNIKYMSKCMVAMVNKGTILKCYQAKAVLEPLYTENNWYNCSHCNTPFSVLLSINCESGGFV